MEETVKGTVIVVKFPFSDLSSTKRRPALVIACGDEDLMLAQITSRSGTNSILIKESDFSKGKLNLESFVRADKIFTLDKKLVLYSAGKLKKEKVLEIENALIQLIKK